MVELVGQQVGSAPSSSSVTINYSSTAGNTLILYVATNANSVTDSAGNTWVLAGDTATQGAGAQRIGEMYYCLDADPITSVTITRTAGGNTNQAAMLSEWSGVDSIRDTKVISRPDTADESFSVVAGDMIVSGSFAWVSGGAPLATPFDYTSLSATNSSSVTLTSAYMEVISSGSHNTPWNGPSSIGIISTSLVPAENPDPDPEPSDDELAVVGQAIANDYSSTITVNYSSTAGNTLVVFCNSNGSNTVTDSAGNTWTLAGDTIPLGATSQRQGQMYYCVNADPVTSVTISRASSTNFNVSLTEWQGVKGFRSARSVSQPGDETIDASAGDLLISTHFTYSASSSPKTVPSDYTELTPSVRANFILSIGYRQAASNGTHIAGWGTGNAGVITAAFITVDSDYIVAWNGNASQSIPSLNTGGLSLVSQGPRSPALQANNSSGTRSIAYWDIGQHSVGTARVYFKTPTEWGSSATKIFSFETSDWTSRAALVISGSGAPRQVRILRSGGNNVVTYSNVVDPDTWYRAEFMIDQPNGRARVYIYEGDATTPILDPGWVSSSFGAIYDRVIVGIDKATPAEQPWVFDDIEVRSRVGLIGPAGLEEATPPTRKGWIGGTNQVGQPWRYGGVNNRFAKPAGAEVGDWMIVTATWTDNNFWVTDSDGWIPMAEDSRTNTLHSQVWGKILEEGEDYWTFTGTNGANVTYTMMWGSGAAPISEWGMGVWMSRQQSATVTSNIANPGLATFTPASLVLTISTERTNAAESGIASMAGATEWFFQGHLSGNVETQSVGYSEVNSVGVSPTVIVTYQNTQNVNGNIVQFALPPAGWSRRDVGNLRGISTANSNGSSTFSLSANLPTEAQVGDVAIVSGTFSTGSAAVVTGPAGYTEICNKASNSNTAVLGIWHKVLTTEDLGQSVTMNCDLSRGAAMTVTVWSGVMYDAISAAYIPTGAMRSDASLLSVTPRRNNAILLGIVHSGHNSDIVAGAVPPLHWQTINDNITPGLGTGRQSIHTFIRRVPLGERIATLDSNGLVKLVGTGFYPVSAVVALSFMPVSVWDGSQRLSARIVGVWDGSQIVPASFKQIE